MAEHFLDTEVRPWIPSTALTCLDAGLTPPQAQDIWKKDIAPTVGWNLLSVAGEWAYWDEDWLCAQIEKTRRANILSKLITHRGLARLAHSMWIPIEKSMLHLAPLNQETRKLHARALADLARFYFDFDLPVSDGYEQTVVTLMHELYPNPFLDIIETATYEDEGATGPVRVKDALRVLHDAQVK